MALPSSHPFIVDGNADERDKVDCDVNANENLIKRRRESLLEVRMVGEDDVDDHLQDDQDPGGPEPMEENVLKV